MWVLLLAAFLWSLGVCGPVIFAQNVLINVCARLRLCILISVGSGVLDFPGAPLAVAVAVEAVRAMVAVVAIEAVLAIHAAGMISLAVLFLSCSSSSSSLRGRIRHFRSGGISVVSATAVVHILHRFDSHFLIVVLGSLYSPVEGIRRHLHGVLRAVGKAVHSHAAIEALLV